MRTLNDIELDTVSGGGGGGGRGCGCDDGHGGISVGDVLSGNAILNGNSFNAGNNSINISGNGSGNRWHYESSSKRVEESRTHGGGGGWGLF